MNDHPIVAGTLMITLVLMPYVYAMFMAWLEDRARRDRR